MARKNFHHPFPPYDIQQEFMEAVYNCIEDGKVGIFESPTGTGKSLSLICGSLTWLREHRQKRFNESFAAIQLDDDDPEWMVEHAREERRNEARRMRADLATRLEAARKREQKIRERDANPERAWKKRKLDLGGSTGSHADEDQYLLDDYESDGAREQRDHGQTVYSSETTKLMDKLGMLQSQQQDHSLEQDEEELKVFFCSRTHSQLSQFVGELKRVTLPPSLPLDPNEADASEALKHLTLGSRKNLCINPKVSTLESQTAINERCVELQQSSTPADRKCPCLPDRKNQELVLDFRDHALANIRDIEDLANVGRRLQVCPYYASRSAISPAEMVTLPYPLLLQKSAREALGISLKGHIVIIDEAHNLINAVEAIHAARITDRQLRHSRECLMIYLQKFRNRLKGSNRVYVTQIIRVVDALLLAMDSYKKKKDLGGTLDPNSLLSGNGVDQINLSKLIRYVGESKLARKVEGYVAYLETSKQENSKTPKAKVLSDVPSLTHLQTFLATLMNPSKEGQFFWAKEADGIILRYLLLDPSEHFRDIVEDARAVILAGGTMSPMNEYQQQLFPYLGSVQTLSCGHLVPHKNLLVRTVTSDKNGPLEFTYKTRGDTGNPARLGYAVQDIARLVDGGLVVFFSSYKTLSDTIHEWKKTSMLDSLRKVKPVYYDEPEQPAEATFESYCESVRSNDQGAMLLSVLGGKLSEGINFSDRLGRCVIVVGLPYPNLETPEWKAKMRYIEDRAAARGEPKGRASRDYAENVCMRSVNQAIGRVIRHKDDWASIVLIDQRYSRESIRGKLPGWIKESMDISKAPSSALDVVVGDVEHFFDQRSS